MDIDQIDQQIVNQYPISLALKYQQALLEEDSFAKIRALSGALETLLKYCACIAIQDSYRMRLNPVGFSPTSIEQLLSLTTQSIVDLLTETLFLFRRNKESIFEPGLYLLFYKDFTEIPELRSDTSNILQALLEFAREYPYRGVIKSNEFECETDFYTYFPLVKDLYVKASFLVALPLLYFHDPMDELEAMEQPSQNSLATAEKLMGIQAIAQALTYRRLPGAPFGHIAIKSRRSDNILSLHPLLMLVETIQLLSFNTEELFVVGPHVVIFFDEIRGADREKLLHYWQFSLSKQGQNTDAPKLTLTSQSGLLNRFTEWVKTSRGNKTRTQLAQQVAKYIEQRNLAAAIAEFKKICESEPNNLAVATRLAELYIPANLRQEATESFRKIAEKCLENGLIPQAMLLYQRVNKLSPTDITSSLKLANLCAEQGCEEVALQQCERIVEYANQTNAREGVLKALELAVSLKPEDAKNQRRLAEIYLAKNQKQQALKSLLAAGEALYNQSQFQAAAEIYEEVLKVKPLHQLAFEMLGYIYLKLGENQKSIEMLVPCCQSEPNNTNFLKALAEAYINADELENAHQTLSTLVTLDQRCSEQCLELARKFFLVENLDKVVSVLELCLNTLISERKEKQIINLLEGCLVKNPQHTAALKKLTETYLLTKDNQNLKYALQRLAHESRSQGNWEEAKSALRQLLNLEPRNASYLVQLRDLESLR